MRSTNGKGEMVMSTYIEDVYARQILDSRGNPTVEVDLRLWNFVTATNQNIWAKAFKKPLIMLII